MGLAFIASGCLAVLGLLFYRRVFRPYHLSWGATTVERRRTFAGDEYVETPRLKSTRAITINGGAESVWPWLVQWGQGRGGFYGYDGLNNFFGCQVRSSSLLMTEFQTVDEGDIIRVHPRMGCVVSMVNQGRALVLRAVNLKSGRPLCLTEPPRVAMSLAFVLFERDDGTTRLIIRERFECDRPDKRMMMEVISLLTFMTIRKMLMGVKGRVEQQAVRVPTRIT